ncbi:MAG: hypothetical protein JRL30_10630 [Deltaproteobacteria bacterium]|nr:hypothetical protein [Deltaproteobacteria bacterium]
MKPLRTLLLIFFLVWVSGCTSPPKPRIATVPETTESSDLLMSDTLIDEKIKLLEEILKREGLSEKGRKIVSKVLNACRLLKESSRTRLTEKDYQKIVSSLSEAVSLMDKTYYGARREGCRTSAEALTRFAKKRRNIIDLYLKGHFRGVVNQVLELKTVFGPDALTPEIGLLFAVSLAREGDLEQAIQIGNGIANELDQLPDVIELRSRIAQWQLALGRKDRALQTYERLSDNQDERIALVQKVKRQMDAAEKGAHTERPVIAEPGPGPDALTPEGGYTMDRLLKEVRSLVEKHAYTKARILLLRERLKIADGPENELLDRELEKIDQEEAAFQEQKRIRDAYVKQTRETATQLIEQEKYKEAIDTFSQLEAAQELDPESKALKERAVESLINKERNRAAEIFLTAKKTRDPSKKKELLDSAYQILKGLIDTYPSSPLNQKLKSHMAIVQIELDRLK